MKNFLIGWAILVALILAAMFYHAASARTGDPVWEGYNLFPTGVTTTGVTPVGQAKYNTDKNFIAVGDGTNTRAYLPAEPMRVSIGSPQSQANPNYILIPPPFSGATFVLTGATFYATQSGCSVVGIYYTGPTMDWRAESGTTIFSGVSIYQAGTSIWWVAFNSGTTLIPPDRAIVVKWGPGSTANTLSWTWTGYWEGAQ